MASSTSLPQLNGGLFLTDGGLETDMIFNHGFDLPAFAAHTMLATPEGEAALRLYFLKFLRLAREQGTGFILDCPTWRAQGAYASELGVEETELWRINRDAVEFARDLRARQALFLDIVVNGLIGPCGDAYAAEQRLTAAQAEDYHSQQVRWLADAGVDMVSAMTFGTADEAIGVARAAKKRDVPVVISFTVETDGCLPSGQRLGDAIVQVDRATAEAPAYYMVNCAHPDHFSDVLDGPDWTHRVRGVRCNASRASHAELDEAETLDDGNPAEFGELTAALIRKLPWLNVFGGCCGSDLRHIAAVVRAVRPLQMTA
ncbi:MAG: homocysteine S-methyltransferase family protein [Pseudomonadota bacterium]